MKNNAEQYKVRQAGFNDAVGICAIIREHPDEVLPRSIGDVVQNIDRFLVCELAGEMVGCASWQILPEIGQPKDPSIELKSIAVKKGHQGAGVGSMLVNALIEHVKTFNPTQIIVLTFSPEFFRKFGFVETPKEKLMHKLYMGCMNCTKCDSPFTCPEVAMALPCRE